MVGRNTQGVRIMRLDKEDALAAVVRVPRDEAAAAEATAAEAADVAADVAADAAGGDVTGGDASAPADPPKSDVEPPNPDVDSAQEPPSEQ